MRGFLLVLATVLGAIGAGVAVEAAAPLPAYGPPGARFRAAFPTGPSHSSEALQGIGAMNRYRSSGPAGSLTVTVWSYDGTGWTGFDGRPAVRARCGRRRCEAVYSGLGRRTAGRIVTWTAQATGTSAGLARTLATSLAPVAPVAPRRSPAGRATAP